MEEIKRQVGRAQRRLIGQQFLSIVVWSLFATLLVGAIGLAVPKIWALPLLHDVWTYSWLGGSFAVGLVVALVWTYLVRRSSIEAAIELDRRFGLKERVSSTLALSEEERTSEVGKALVADAIRKVERVDVREQFNFQPSWRFALPLVPAAVITGLLFIPNASLENKANANTEKSPETKKKLLAKAEMIKQLARKNDEKKDKTEEELKSENELKEIAKRASDVLNNEKLDKKEAILKLNDIAKDVEKRQKELGGAKEMKKQLDKLGKIEQGPADKMAKAMKEGDFKEAQKQLEKLKEDLKAGNLKEEDKQQIAKQMEQLKDKIKQMAEDAKEAREKLEQEIAKKLEQGDQEGAAKLQEKLDKMNQAGKKAEDMMNKLAEKMGQCAQCMKEGGDPKEAAEKLDKLAQAMKDAQEQLDQMENLDEVLDQLADAKDAMNGKEGKQGKEGMEGEDGNGMQMNGKNKNGRPGRGLGAGRGEGERPEEEVETKSYDTQVKGNAKKGESVKYGETGGANLKGQSLQQAKAEMESAVKRDPDALNDVTLPRELKNQTIQYFDKFRKGEK